LRRKIIFSAEALKEFDNAVAWHDEQQPGLGDRFENAVDAVFQKILQNPERFRLVGRTVRTVKLKVFDSYRVLFHVEPDFIGIVAVFHGARHPASLHRRLK
jgi:plasmid stabilization system protein ParE